MKKASLAKFQRLLESITARVGADTSGMFEQVHAGSHGNGDSDLSNAPMHLADMGTDEFLYDMNAALLGNEQYIVAEVRDALARIELGTFGKCQTCGKPIAEARLAVIPYTRYCIACAEKRRHAASQFGRRSPPLAG